MRMTSWHLHHKDNPIRINSFTRVMIEGNIRGRT